MATITTDLMYRALPYIYRGNTLEEFLAGTEVPEDMMDAFESFWHGASLEYERASSDKKIQWDVPHEW